MSEPTSAAVARWWIERSAVESIGGPPSDTPLVRRADALTALDAVIAENERLRDALEQIAATKSRFSLEAVQIARKALGDE